jgi:hypothetical protein
MGNSEWGMGNDGRSASSQPRRQIIPADGAMPASCGAVDVPGHKE